MYNEIKRVTHVNDVIVRQYPRMNTNKFDVVKIGPRIYLYAVDSHNNLQRFKIFQGNLPAVNEVPVLRQQLDRNIKAAVQKLGYMH